MPSINHFDSNKVNPIKDLNFKLHILHNWQMILTHDFFFIVYWHLLCLRIPKTILCDFLCFAKPNLRLINILFDFLAHTSVTMCDENLGKLVHDLVYDQTFFLFRSIATEQNCINIMQSKTQILIRFECFDTGWMQC